MLVRITGIRPGGGIEPLLPDIILSESLAPSIRAVSYELLKDGRGDHPVVFHEYVLLNCLDEVM